MTSAATLLSTRSLAFPLERSNKLALPISTQTMPDDFEKFVEEHYQPAFRFALSLSRNHDDACDLTQQAFFIAQTNQRQLRDRSKGKQWLFTILRREFLRTKRHEAVRQRYDVELEGDDSPLISVDHAANMDAKSLVTVLQGLDDHFRLPVSLFYFDQLSYKEIADILEVPIGTVMSRLARGKTMLRQRLESSRVTAAGKIVKVSEQGGRQSG
jgi:RNA polymerase sigma-70 factor, ECF subfamily